MTWRIKARIAFRIAINPEGQRYDVVASSIFIDNARRRGTRYEGALHTCTGNPFAVTDPTNQKHQMARVPGWYYTQTGIV